MKKDLLYLVIISGITILFTEGLRNQKRETRQALDLALFYQHQRDSIQQEYMRLYNDRLLEQEHAYADQEI